MKNLTAQKILEALKRLGDGDSAKARRFFGASYTPQNDIFLNVSRPLLAPLAKENRDIALLELTRLVQSAIHEARFCALRIWRLKMEKALKKKESQALKELTQWYLEIAKKGYINNWDLVDDTAPTLGLWLMAIKEQKLLNVLRKSRILWLERIAIVATLPMIKAGSFKEIFEAAHVFKTHPHDLIHKALGWMLREVGKRNKEVLMMYLEKNSNTLPRTTLRYAIERFTPKERYYFLTKKNG